MAVTSRPVATRSHLSRPAAGKPAAARRTVAVRLRDWSEWCRQVVRGVQHFAHDRPSWRLHVEIGMTDAVRVAPDELVIDGMITGIIGTSTPWRRLLREARTQVVALTAAVPNSMAKVVRVQVDDALVARTIGQHLLAGGFRRLAYFGTLRPGFRNARSRGLLSFAQTENIPCEIFEPKPGKSMGVPMAQLTRWVKKLPKPVGIAAWNINIARNVIQACQRAHVSVPEEVAVVAWDDDPLLAETLEPTITAIVLPAERVGFEAAKLLDQLMEGAGPRPTEPVTIAPSGILHVRQSSDVSSLKDRNVHLAVQYINEHATEPLKVTQIAHELRISRRKLEQDFVRVTGQTLHEAIVRVRLERAKQLLLDTDWRLERVADRSGMGSTQTLIRRVLRHEGITPAEFRERFRPR
jgi:LacI family transcriptional regulator